MDNLGQILIDYINNDEIIQNVTASNPRNREKIQKLRIRPVLKKEEIIYQAESFVGTKVYHNNISKSELPEFIVKAMQEDFKQLELETEQHKVIAFVSRKGKVTVKTKNKQKASDDNLPQIDFSHNRKKNYILPTGTPVPFLVELGVQTPDGKVVNAKYDKFRQINRYLEFVRDILPHLPKEEGRTLNIIDFGCGKPI